MELDKYRPKTLGEFVGNKVLVRDMLRELKNKLCNILVMGPPGSGKSLVCDLVGEAVSDRFDVLHVKTRQNDDVRQIKDLIDTFVRNKTIESFFSTKQKLVVIDDIDIMLAIDRNFVSFLGSLVSSNAGAAIIMTCNQCEEKRVADLKKKTTVLKLSYPSFKDAFVFLDDVLTKAKIEYEYERLKKMIEAYRCNIRNILMNIHLLDAAPEEVETVRAEKLMTDSNHFDILRRLFKVDTDISDLRYISDSTIVPLMMYENFPKEIFQNRYKMSNSQLFDMFEQIIDNMLDAEIHETHMYHKLDWDMYDNTNIIKMGFINYFLKQCKRKKAARFDAFAFTPILTKLSLKQNFGKKLVAAKAELGIYETENVYRAMDELERQGVNNHELSEAVAGVLYAYVTEVHGHNKTDIAKMKRKRTRTAKQKA